GRRATGLLSTPDFIERRGSSLTEVPRSEREERRPVRPVGVTARVLPKGEVAVHETRLDGRERGCPKPLLAEQLIHRLRSGGGHEPAARVHPCVALVARADEDR